jgi:hypothetical protein
MRIASGLCMRGMRATMIIVLLCLGHLIPNGGIVAQPAGLEKIQHVIVIIIDRFGHQCLLDLVLGINHRMPPFEIAESLVEAELPR